MWLGLLYTNPDEACESDGAMVTLCAWEAGRPRPLTIGAPVEAAPQVVHMMREAGRSTSIQKPRCDACGTSFDLPID